MFIIYIKPHCKYSINAVKLLVRNKLSHKIVLINNQETQHHIKIFHNFFTFPQIFYKNKFIGGYDDLQIYISKFD